MRISWQWATLDSILKLLAAILLLASPVSFSGEKPHERTGHRVIPDHNNSDWWSITGSRQLGDRVRILHRDVNEYVFRILGIDLDLDDFSSVFKKLGDSPEIARGDGSTSRRQICYVSASNDKSPTYLIFENGEVNSAFYLFSDNLQWDGRRYCTPSELVTGNLRTSAGLQLGETMEQVAGLLGEPSRRRKDEMIYFIEREKRSSESEISLQRLHHPELKEEQLREAYGTYALTVFIWMKFEDSRLIYLGISKSETF